MWIGDVTGLKMPVPKLVMDYVHKEAYVIHAGYFVNASDQKFLIERVEDEDVTEPTIHVQNLVLSCSGRTTWTA